MALEARKQGLQGIILPEENYQEALLVDGLEVVPVRRLRDVVSFYRVT